MSVSYPSALGWSPYIRHTSIRVICVFATKQFEDSTFRRQGKHIEFEVKYLIGNHLSNAAVSEQGWNRWEKESRESAFAIGVVYGRSEIESRFLLLLMLVLGNTRLKHEGRGT